MNVLGPHVAIDPVRQAQVDGAAHDGGAAPSLVELRVAKAARHRFDAWITSVGAPMLIPVTASPCGPLTAFAVPLMRMFTQSVTRSITDIGSQKSALPHVTLIPTDCAPISA